MNKSNRTLLIIALAVVVVLFLLFGGGAMNGSMMNGEMMGQGWNNGFGSWLIQALLTLGLGILIGWLMFARKK